ncbi:hypothetical protein [Zavarzinella formosa]|uniref:hypothetical protein n=1 Tax=Zavarzinella formosa TaxID=360055 RepID=UPI0002DDF727|nr:hypothetical protein [Zavarzinella formosa]
MFRYLSLFTAFLWLLLPTPSYASGFWYGFKKYWAGFLADQDGVVMTVIILGIVGVLIISSGKWKK